MKCNTFVLSLTVAAACVASCRSAPDLPTFRDAPDAVEGGASDVSSSVPVAASVDLPVDSDAAPTAAIPGIDPEADFELGQVAGVEISARELLRSLAHRHGDTLRGQVNRMIGDRLARQEAARIGLRVDPDMLDERTSEHLGEFARNGVPEDMELDDFVSQVMQQDPRAFRAAVRGDTLGELVTERVVRAFTLTNPHARIRLLVADAETVADALSRERAGESFEALVRELSRDRTAERGGIVPFVVKNESSPLSRLVFQTGVGEIGGPLSVSEGGPEILVQVESRPPPLEGDWTQLSSDVEQSLTEEPVSEEEFLFWQVSMERRYTVDLSPFEDLIGR